MFVGIPRGRWDTEFRQRREFFRSISFRDCLKV